MNTSEHAVIKMRINAANRPTLPASSGEEKENSAASERELAARMKMAILSDRAVFIGLL